MNKELFDDFFNKLFEDLSLSELCHEEKGAKALAKKLNELIAYSFFRACGGWKKNNIKSLALIESGLDVNLEDKNGKTALMMAAQKGLFQVFRALIQQGADVLKKNNMGKDAYHFAMSKGDKVIVKEIINTVKKKMMFCLVSQNQLVTLERE